MKRSLAFLLFGILAFSQGVVKTHSKRYYALRSLQPNEQQDLKFFYDQQQHNVMQFSNSKTQTCMCSFKKSTCSKRESFETI